PTVVRPAALPPARRHRVPLCLRSARARRAGPAARADRGPQTPARHAAAQRPPRAATQRAHRRVRRRRFSPRVQARVRGHRLEAARVALPIRPVEGLGQVQEPGSACGKTRGRGGLGMKAARNTKKSVPSLDVQSICEIAERAFWDGVEILSVIEVLEIGNQTRVQKAINKSDVRFAADIIKNALFTRLILLVARAHGGKDVWAGDRHAGMAFEQLKRFPQIANKMQSPTDVADAQRLWDKCRDDHRREGFLHYRDRYLAHLGEPDQDPPKYDDVFGFARATAAAL